MIIMITLSVSNWWHFFVFLQCATYFFSRYNRIEICDHLVTWFLPQPRWQPKKIRKNQHKNVSMQSVWIQTCTVLVIQRREKYQSICHFVSLFIPVLFPNMSHAKYYRFVTNRNLHHFVFNRYMPNVSHDHSDQIFLSVDLCRVFLFFEKFQIRCCECILRCDDFCLIFLDVISQSLHFRIFYCTLLHSSQIHKCMLEISF